MPIHFITGKPGAGKGLQCANWIERELTDGDRPIVTNFAVEPHPWVTGRGKPQLGLLAYLRSKYGGRTFNAENRIFRISDAQAEKFYLFRAMPQEDKSGLPKQYKLEEAQADVVRIKSTDEERVMGFDTSLMDKSGPCLYIIDEAWKFWGARNWQKTGEGLLFYNAQHRKAGDDVLICTQHTKQIDSAVQRVAQDFWVCRNRSLLRLGAFRQPDDFTVHVYEMPPNGTSQEPMMRKKFKLDAAGLAQTYDTTAGVGLGGRMAGDVGKKKTGLPWKALIALCCLVPIICFVGIKTALGMAMKKATKEMLPPKSGTNTAMSVAQKIVENQTFGGVGSSQGKSYYVATNKEPPVVEMTGYCTLNGRIRVFLSDGSEYEAGDGHLNFLCPRYSIIDGKTNWIAKGPKVNEHNSSRLSEPRQFAFPPSPTVAPSSLITIGSRPTMDVRTYAQTANQFYRFNSGTR